jgi:hypothetical protein
MLLLVVLWAMLTVIVAHCMATPAWMWREKVRVRPQPWLLSPPPLLLVELLLLVALSMLLEVFPLRSWSRPCPQQKQQQGSRATRRQQLFFLCLCGVPPRAPQLPLPRQSGPLPEQQAQEQVE